MSSPAPCDIPTIDPSELGLHVLVDHPGIDDVAADVVAIPGIGAHPKEAFVYQDQYKEVNWLSDKTMLPATCPKVRILCYFYDSMWVGDNPTRQSFHNIAKVLLNKLVAERRDCPQRPIVFVSHCLGGIVAQRAYNMASTNKTDFPDIYDSITGLLSLGTPFHGASMGNTLSEMFQKITAMRMRTQNNLINQLVRDNDMLVDIVQDFTRDTATRRFAPMIYCFYEQRETKFGAIANMETGPEFVVGESSGTLAGQRSEGLALDHFKISKFGHCKDSHFKSVSSTIREMVDKSAKILEERGVGIYRPQSMTVRPRHVLSKTVPFKEEPNLVERGGILQKMDDRFAEWGRTVLCGEAGTGKTHLSTAYAAGFAREFPTSRCHWVNANTAEQFELSYKAIARSLRLADAANDPMQAVYNHLKHDLDERWLMIVDDLVEDADLTSTNPAHGGRSLLEFVPDSHNFGWILMTTRSKSLAHRLIRHRDECLIDVPPLDAAGAAQLLLGHVSQDANKQKAAARVVQEIGNSPVALTLAYAYRRHIQKSSLTKYLETLKEQPPRDQDKSKSKDVINGVYRAWLPLFNHLRHHHPETGRMLLLIGVLDLPTVPTHFIALKGERVVEREIKTLEQYGMVEPVVNLTVFGVTALIRQCIQVWLVEHDPNLKPAYEEKALLLMRKAAYSTKEGYAPSLHPCALAILAFPAPKALELKRDRADLLFKVGLYDLQLGRCRRAVQFFEECLSLREKDPVSRDLVPETRTALNQAKHREQQLSRLEQGSVEHLNAHNNSGSDSLAVHHPTPQDHQASHGIPRHQAHQAHHVANISPTPSQPPKPQDHTTWLDAYNRGIAMSRSAGSSPIHQAQALDLYLTALRIALPLLGATHQATLRILGSVALTKHMLGDREAGEILKIVYAEQQALLGPDHADTLITRKNRELMMQNMGIPVVTKKKKKAKALPPPPASQPVRGSEVFGGVQEVRELHVL
ncbi:hypothetical protein QBC44DRAFT_335307 [Cladorrhinum sp. PSN332]|nr:hypothetical protein QBC44DRAFT_335307 [Cladorrhinum sp. PSN332]